MRSQRDTSKELVSYNVFLHLALLLSSRLSSMVSSCIILETILLECDSFKSVSLLNMELSTNANGSLKLKVSIFRALHAFLVSIIWFKVLKRRLYGRFIGVKTRQN